MEEWSSPTDDLFLPPEFPLDSKPVRSFVTTFEVAEIAGA
jgi:hypothetical protein